MVTVDRSEADLAKFGLSPSDVADDNAVELWPDTEPAAHLFIELQTQWRWGPVGPTGLDYAAVESVMRLKAIPRADRADLLGDLRVMEDEALRAFAKESK